jgi:hypothetical protein
MNYQCNAFGRLVFETLLDAFDGGRIHIDIETLMKFVDGSKSGVEFWLQTFQDWGVMTIEDQSYFSFYLTSIEHDVTFTEMTV